jgi:hypothetical protein
MCAQVRLGKQAQIGWSLELKKCAMLKGKSVFLHHGHGERSERNSCKASIYVRFLSGTTDSSDGLFSGP